MIFETKRLRVRKLQLTDLDAFHLLQSNPKVMQFVDGNVKNYEEHRIELLQLIKKYSTLNNDFWIYAIENKLDNNFVGTVALIKDKNDDEIGYRFLENYWNLGLGTEICAGLIIYCKHLKIKKLVAYVTDKNRASVKILERNNFKIAKHFMNSEQQKETKYLLEL